MKSCFTLYFTCISPILLLIYIDNTEGLLVHNSTDAVHGLSGHNVDLAEVMQLLQNQTAEIENLKQQKAEIQTLKQQAETLKQQTQNDRSTIQLLQKRVFFLEAELNKLNVSSIPSVHDFSTYLKGMNQLTQNLAANEAKDRNLSQTLNDAVQALDDLKLKDASKTMQLMNQSVELKQLSEKDKSSTELLQNETQQLAKNLDDLKKQVRYASLSLLDIHAMTEQVNGSLIQFIEERIISVNDQIANVSKRNSIGFTASVSSDNSSWNSGTLVFPVVITNVGNGYNPSTGVFTAPIAGVYAFFVNVQKYDTNDIYVELVMNGVSKVRTMSYGSSDSYDAGPNLAVLSLQKDDRVWIRHFLGQGYYDSGRHITTFSGFLL